MTIDETPWMPCVRFPRRLPASPERRSGRQRPGQARSGIARTRARAVLNAIAEGQRAGRYSVTRRAEPVSRPARLELRPAEGLGRHDPRAGRRSPASATRRSSPRDGSTRSRLCDDRTYQVSFSVGRCCLEQLHRPRSEGHLFCVSRHPNEVDLSVDPAWRVTPNAGRGHEVRMGVSVWVDSGLGLT